MKIEALVAEAIALDREAALLEEKFKVVRKKLVDYAKLDKENQVKTEKGGLSWSARDDDGNLARVTFAARSLKEGIDLEGELTDKVRDVVPKGLFSELFVQATYYKLVDNFRERAAQLLEKPIAGQVVKLVTSKGKTNVGFETKEVA
jgi:hypothetical protein